MHRRLLAPLLAASLFLPAAALAVEFKPAIGLTFTDVASDPQTGSATAKAGWQIGGTVLLGERLYFEGGLFYAKKSTDISATTNVDTVDYNGITGLRVPAMVGFKLLGAGQDPVNVRAFGGGSVFFVTAVDATGLSKSDFESPTYGVFAGLGLDVLMVFVDAKYEWSLTDLSKVSTVDVGQTRSIYLNAGIRF